MYEFLKDKTFLTFNYTNLLDYIQICIFLLIIILINDMINQIGIFFKLLKLIA